MSRRKKGALGLPRGARRRERGCRTPIRSIAAYSPYTFTTSLEFSALCLFFLTSFKILPEKDTSVTRRMHTIPRFRPVAVRNLFSGLWSIFLSSVIEHDPLRGSVKNMKPRIFFIIITEANLVKRILFPTVLLCILDYTI